uniref:Uncharacterized protein n=1 Tax=Clastoptera arizonana TaxID=38151 RepID=A0A1B6DLW7_9HEMI
MVDSVLSNSSDADVSKLPCQSKSVLAKKENRIMPPLPAQNSFVKTTKATSQQSSLKNFVIKPLPIPKLKALNDHLLRMVVKEYHPFSIVEDPEFIKLLQMHNPAYQLPSRKTLTESMLPVAYNTLKANIMKQINDVSCSAYNRQLDLHRR